MKTNKKPIKMKNYTTSFTVKLTADQLQTLKQIRADSKLSVSALIRESIAFYSHYYAKKTAQP